MQIIFILIFILIYIRGTTTLSSVNCLYKITLYNCTIFGQINHKINLILNEKATLFKRRKLIINETKQKQLINLIHEHNLAVIEIHKMNLIAIGCFYITFAMMKIMSLYLLVNFNEFFIKLFLMLFNYMILIFRF